MSFKISNNLQSGTNLSKVVYANQQPFHDADLNDEIAFYKDGILTSSPDLKYDGSLIETSAAISAGTVLQTNAPPGSDGGNIRIISDGGNNIIDMSTTAAGPGFGSRILSLTSGSDPTKKNLSIQTKGGEIFLQAPVRVGSVAAPAFKLDYRASPAAVGPNQVTTIFFTTSTLFTSPPVVVATANTPTASTGDQAVHVEEITATSFKVEYLGVAAAGTFINWIALGV